MHLIVLPNQLYNIDFSDYQSIIMVEDPKFFSDFRYNKNKLFYHRATMKHYFRAAKSKIAAKYIECSDFKRWRPAQAEYAIFDPLDRELEKRYSFATILPSPMFLASKKEILAEFKGKSLNHVSFYRWQRRRLGILMKNGAPEGNQWSFDKENRKNLPSSLAVPVYPHVAASEEIREARLYVNKHWKSNYGKMTATFPISRAGALKWLSDFIDHRFAKFGEYEDASHSEHLILFHSGLSPMMNIGLLTDKDVVEAALAKRVPIASKEGFLRQVIGWRNYIYAHYLLNGEKIRKMNFFGHTRKLSDDWWKGVGIEPLDNLIGKIVKTGYVHHIERLMYLGSFMLMQRIHPSEVYRIFMEWTIDAYEWVMIPNIYGMSQFADGGIVMKKPYFSSSSYILRMSNFKKGPWCEVWDAAFWLFIGDNKDYFSHTAFAAHVKKWNSMTAAKRKSLREIMAKYKK